MLRVLFQGIQQSLLILRMRVDIGYIPIRKESLILNYVNFKTYKTLGDRSFMVAAPSLRNNLSLEVRKAPKIDNFEKLLKKLLIKKAFFTQIAKV